MDEAEKTVESPEDAELREYVLKDFEKPVTPEQAKRLDQELADTAEFFGAGGIDFYVAGGSGLDLLDGEWKRDHQDLDAGIQDKDRMKFLEQAEREGFIITDHERKPLSKEDVLDPQRHNCFTFRDRNGVQEGFETMFLPEGDEAAYENAPKVEKAGHEIRLQPPEIILFHKLLDGRRKDFRDIRKVWSMLDAARKADVQRRFDEAGTRFRVGGKEETSVEALLAAAPAAQKEKDLAFFEGGTLDGMKDKTENEFQETVGKFLDVREDAASREEFMEGLAEKFGGFMPEKRAVMEMVADFLYQEPAPDDESFTSWSRMVFLSDAKERLKSKASHEFKEEKIWETV